MNTQELFNFMIKNGMVGEVKYIKAFFTVPYFKNKDEKYETDILLIKDGKVFLKFNNEKLEITTGTFPILDYMEELEINDIPIHLHTANPVGRENMRRIIQKNGWKEV